MADLVNIEKLKGILLSHDGAISANMFVHRLLIPVYPGHKEFLASLQRAVQHIEKSDDISDARKHGLLHVLQYHIKGVQNLQERQSDDQIRYQEDDVEKYMILQKASQIVLFDMDQIDYPRLAERRKELDKHGETLPPDP